MLENNNLNEKEINLNLKIPPEQQDDAFSMRDLVLTIYNARKIFFIFCLIGLLLGVIAAAGYYASNTGNAKSESPTSLELNDIAITLIINYPEARFNVDLFFEPELWENTLKKIGKSDVTLADAMGDVKITRYKPEEGESNVLNQLQFELIIPSDSEIFAGNNEKEMFLLAFCEEFRNQINLINEWQFKLDSIKFAREHYLARFNSYNSLLSSLEETDTDKAVEILTAALHLADTAADLLLQIQLMERNIEVFDLEELSKSINENYERNSESNLFFTTPVTTMHSPPTSAVSTTRLLMLFVGLTFVGFAFGFCAAFVKKYIPEKTEKTEKKGK
ncbi:MAG: hypothetical protein FWD48_02405 [Oscillospiraceae bacterium]|nr:hypothetical protein [Oscillospiraceae bacterium]